MTWCRGTPRCMGKGEEHLCALHTVDVLGNALFDELLRNNKWSSKVSEVVQTKPVVDIEVRWSPDENERLAGWIATWRLKRGEGAALVAQHWPENVGYELAEAVILPHRVAAIVFACNSLAKVMGEIAGEKHYVVRIVMSFEDAMRFVPPYGGA